MIDQYINYHKSQLSYLISLRGATLPASAVSSDEITPHPPTKKRKIRKILISDSIISQMKLGGIFDIKYKVVLSLIKTWFANHPEIENSWTHQATEQHKEGVFLKQFYRELYNSEESSAEELRNLVNTSLTEIDHLMTTLSIPSRLLSPPKDKEYFEDVKKTLNDEEYGTFYKSTSETLKQDRQHLINTLTEWLTTTSDTIDPKSITFKGTYN